MEPSSSLVSRSDVFGRHEEIDTVSHLLRWLSHRIRHLNRLYKKVDTFSVLPIVGMAGLGKTTVARVVFKETCDYFDLNGWVSVSDFSDEVTLAQKILESLTQSSHPSDSLIILMKKLKDTLRGRKFLIVLDGLWNDVGEHDIYDKIYNIWDCLSVSFACGQPGSKILITTRSTTVASFLRTHDDDDAPDYDHNLKPLSDKASLELVRKFVFRNANSREADRKMEVFGEAIVKKCKGVPLTLKRLACLLKCKREDSEWDDILKKELSDLIPASSQSGNGGTSSSLVFVQGGNNSFYEGQQNSFLLNDQSSSECIQVGNVLVKRQRV